MKDYLNELKIIYNILPNNLKKDAKLIIALLSLSGFLETLSLGLFIPLIAIIADGKINFPILDNIFNISQFEVDEIIPSLILIIFLVYLIKSLFLSYVEFGTQKLINKVKKEITSQLFKKYLKNSYKFYLKNNSSILLRNLTTEVIAFTNGIIQSVLMVSKEFFIILFLIILLFIFNYKISIFVLTFGLILIFSIKILLKKILFNLAEKRMDYRGKENKTLLESLQGIKFIKSYNIENNFINKLIPILQVIVDLKSKETTVQLLPRIWIEVIILILLALIGLYFYLFDLGMNLYLSFISLFLIAMLKMLPSFIAISRSINAYQAYKPSINFIKKELNSTTYETQQGNNELTEGKILKFNNDFEIKNIDFKYDSQKFKIFENLNFKINKKGDLIGIYGESGVGKTTLIDILIGLHNPQKGNFFIDGELVDQNLIKGQIFGYVPQSIYLFDESIKNNILIGQKIKLSDENYNDILKQCDLIDFINSLPDKDNTLIGENGVQISGGQKQRIGIARALANNSKILIFDEATSALDKKSEDNIFETIKKLLQKKSIIIITHNKKLLDYCNSIYRLKNKELEKEK